MKKPSKKVHLYESDTFRYFIDEDCTFMDDELLTELPDDLIQEFKEADKRFKELNHQIYSILRSRGKA